MPEHPDFSLPARLRVKRAASFQEAYAQGRKTVGRHLVLWLRSGEDAGLRVGVVASKRVGNSVARSRAKRRLREWFRLNRHRLSGSEDVVLVARHSILRVPQSLLDRDCESVFSRAGLLHCPDESSKPPAFPPKESPDA